MIALIVMLQFTVITCLVSLYSVVLNEASNGILSKSRSYCSSLKHNKIEFHEFSNVYITLFLSLSLALHPCLTQSHTHSLSLSHWWPPCLISFPFSLQSCLCSFYIFHSPKSQPHISLSHPCVSLFLPFLSLYLLHPCLSFFLIPMYLLLSHSFFLSSTPVSHTLPWPTPFSLSLSLSFSLSISFYYPISFSFSFSLYLSVSSLPDSLSHS